MENGVILGTVLIICFVLLAICLSLFISTIISPYRPTSSKILDEIISILKLEPLDILYDLGSGDGRILLRAIMVENIKAYGYEISPLLLFTSKIWSYFISSQAKGEVIFEPQSIYSVDIAQYSKIYIHLNEKEIKNLERHLHRYPKGVVIFSLENKFDNMKESKIYTLSNSQKIYKYEI